ncbi:MAG: hypothetical protein LUH63_22855 [Parabacteroides sp.]|nr:hypothetical protein [Parabacteroides sp.]
MNKSIFTLMTAALLMTGSVFSSAYAAPAGTGEKTFVDASDAVIQTSLEGSKFYLGAPNGDANTSRDLLAVDVITFANGSKLGSINSTAVTIVAGEKVTDGVAVFEARNVKAESATSASFELWSNGVQVAVKAEDGSAFISTDDKDALSTRFMVTYDDKADYGTLEFAKFYYYDASAVPQEMTTITKACLAKAAQNAAFLQEYNSKGITLSFAGKNVIGNAFAETLQPVDVVENAFGNGIPAAPGVVFVKGTEDDVEDFREAAATDNESDATAILALAKKLSFVSSVDSLHKIQGIQEGEGNVIKLLEKGKFDPSTADKLAKGLFTITQIDALNDEATLQLGLGDNLVGGAHPDGAADNVYVTTILADGSNFTYIPATLGESTYLDASVLLKKNAVNTVNIYFTSGKQSIEGDADQQYEYHKYLVAGADASDYQLEARAKSEINLAYPMTQ